jgi:hypothetical protein
MFLYDVLSVHTKFASGCFTGSGERPAGLKCISWQIGCERKILCKQFYGRLIVREKYCALSQNKPSECSPDNKLTGSNRSC